MNINIAYLNSCPDVSTITVTPIPLYSTNNSKIRYIAKTMERMHMLTFKDILLQLEAAIADKDWDTIELLKEEVEFEVEQNSFSQGHNNYLGYDEEED